MYRPEITAHPDHVRIVSRGEFELGAGTAALERAVALAAEKGLDRILVDNRGLERPLAATEKALLGVNAETTYRAYLDAGGQPLRVAFLLPREWLLPYRPLADSLEAIGIEARPFADPGELEAWLGVAAPPSE